MAKSRAVEQRWHEPKTIAESLTGPLAHIWGAAHPELMALAEGRAPAVVPLLCDKLESSVQMNRYFSMHHSARKPSRQVIFLPSE